MLLPTISPIFPSFPSPTAIPFVQALIIFCNHLPISFSPSGSLCLSLSSIYYYPIVIFLCEALLDRFIAAATPRDKTTWLLVTQTHSATSCPHICAYTVAMRRMPFFSFSSSNHPSQSSSTITSIMKALFLYPQGELITDSLESQSSLYPLLCCTLPHYVGRMFSSVILWTLWEGIACSGKFAVHQIYLLRVNIPFHIKFRKFVMDRST